MKIRASESCINACKNRCRSVTVNAGRQPNHVGPSSAHCLLDSREQKKMQRSGRSASVQAASAAAAAAALTSRAVTAGTASRVVAGAMKEASEGSATVEDVEETGDSHIGDASGGSTAGELAQLKKMVASLTAESNKAKKATAEANRAKESAAEANKAKESVSAAAIVTKQPDAGTAEVLEALHLIYFQ